MPITELIEYEFASPEVREVYDDIMATRKTDWINNFWKALANHPPTLRRTWESIKQIMAPGRARPADQGDALPRGERGQRLRLLHRLAHRGRAEGGHDARHVGELLAVVGMASETNSLADAYQVPVDERFRDPDPDPD